MSAMAELRLATWPSHQRLERHLDIKSRFADLAAYKAHIEQMWGFCAALEQALSQEYFGAVLADYERRRKAPILAQDLAALGVTQRTLAGLPRCAAIPSWNDAAGALGCVYVLEGASLGGRTLLPVVERQLGLRACSGAAFLASYGEEVGAMWRKFGSSVDAWCDTAERRARATRAAVATFDALSLWLVGCAA